MDDNLNNRKMRTIKSVVLFLCATGIISAQNGGLLEAYEEAQKQYDVFSNCGSGLDGYMAKLRVLENKAVDASITLTVEEEMELGQSMREQISYEYSFVANPLFENGLSQMLTSKVLEPYIRRKDVIYTLTIYESDELNAFAHAGGYIYISTGLLGFVQSIDELAFIVAHEVSHIDMEHTIRSIKKMLAIQMLGSSYGLEELTDLATDISLMMETPFGQVDEYEADKNAFAIATAAGFDQSKFADFFKRLIAMGAETEKDELAKFSRTHPYLDDRINCINYYIENGL